MKVEPCYINCFNKNFSDKKFSAIKNYNYFILRLMEEINYLSLGNNAKIISCSSQAKSCGASNVLSNDRKVII